MANNYVAKDANSVTVTFASTDIGGGVQAPQIRLTDGTNFMPTMDAVARKGFVLLTDGTNSIVVAACNAALSETAVTSLRVAAGLFALDPAASAGSQLVPVQLESTAHPNLRVSLWNGANEMPSLDVVGRAGFVKVTDGTNVLPTMDAVGRAAFVKVTDGTNTLPTMDAVGRKGFVSVTDGTNTMPTLDVAARAGFQVPTGAAASGMSKGKLRDLGSVQAIKASAGTLYSLHIENNQGAAAWIQIFDLATGSVTLGTTNPDWELLVPANSSKDLIVTNQGVPFGTAISIASTTAEKGNTGSAAGVEIFYTYV